MSEQVGLPAALGRVLPEPVLRLLEQALRDPAVETVSSDGARVWTSSTPGAGEGARVLRQLMGPGGENA